MTASYRLAFSLLVAIGPLSLLAQQPRQPWEWTTEERIARRLDPAAIAERVRVHQGTHPSHAGQSTLNTAAAAPAFVIDGNRNPELFLPWEVMDELLENASGDLRAVQPGRRAYRDAVEASGWDETIFWPTLERLARNYAATKDAAIRFQMRTARRADTLSRSEILERDRLNHEVCSSRAETLQAARARFGAAAFDRFLYTAVAPHMGMASMGATDARTLRWIEGGCR